MDARRQVDRNLHRLGVANGMSQERLALEAGFDRAYVVRERGSENVTLDRIETLAKALSVEVSEVFHGVEDGIPLRLRGPPVAPRHPSLL